MQDINLLLTTFYKWPLWCIHIYWFFILINLSYFNLFNFFTTYWCSTETKEINHDELEFKETLGCGQFGVSHMMWFKFKYRLV